MSQKLNYQFTSPQSVSVMHYLITRPKLYFKTAVSHCQMGLNLVYFITEQKVLQDFYFYFTNLNCRLQSFFK